jgi:hypothetical protein
MSAARLVVVMALVGAALTAAGCGSSQGTASGTSSAASMSTATATSRDPDASIEGDAVSQLPKVAAATEPGRVAGSMDAADERAFLTSVFHDAEAMWTKEFAAAGIRYAQCHRHDLTGGLDARILPAAPALAHDRLRGGRARRLRHLRLVSAVRRRG